MIRHETAPQVAEQLQLVRERLLPRICVRPPYYALQNERIDDGRFVAEAAAELRQGPHVGPMRPGDISRHGAIAGLCALALRQTDDRRRYYLARSAEYRGGLARAPYGAPLRFEAQALELDKRGGRALVRAFHEHVEVASLVVHYAILTDNAFARLHRHFERPNPPREGIAPFPVADLRVEGDVATCDLPSLPVESCSGHFEEHPAAPVALLMDQLAQLGEALQGDRSFIRRGTVEASELCFAGSSLQFRMEREADGPVATLLRGEIRRDERAIGSMELELERA